MIPRIIVPKDLETIPIGIYSRTNFAFCEVAEFGTADIALGIEQNIIHVENDVLVLWAELAGYIHISTCRESQTA